MKKLLMTLTMLLSAVASMHAQQLQVQSLKLDPSDVTASTERRTDASGNPCALVKVRSTTKIAQVTGNVVGDLVNRGSETWVYVTKGTDQLTITPEGQPPINVAFANFQVSSTKGLLTYVLVLDSQVTSGEAKFREAEQYLQDGEFGKAFESIKQSVEEGYVPAFNALGQFYLNGWGVEISPEKAIEYMQKGVDLGDHWAQCNLANQYVLGKIIPQDANKAFELYEKSAIQGNANAQLELANMYSLGKGTVKDLTKTVEWTTKAAEQGHVHAQAVLGSYYLMGIGTSKDHEKGIYWMEKAAEQDHIQAMKGLGNAYIMEGKAEKAMEYFKRGALLGDPQCMSFVASGFLTGEYGMQKDFDKAFEYFKRAEEGGSTDMVLYSGLAQCYERGLGTPKNKKLANKYKELAEKARIEAQQNIRDLRKQVR